MKQLLFIALFLPLGLCAQDSSIHKCPIGETYIHGLQSTGMIVQDGCWPDSLAIRVTHDFLKELCEGELGFYSMGGGMNGGMFSAYHHGHYDDSSAGCMFTDVYEKEITKVINGKKKKVWVKISHEEYKRLCKCEFELNEK